jgi:hypothetical protein
VRLRLLIYWNYQAVLGGLKQVMTSTAISSLVLVSLGSKPYHILLSIDALTAVTLHINRLMEHWGDRRLNTKRLFVGGLMP